MTIKAATVEEYIAQLSDDRQEAIQKLRKAILKKLPKGFHEEMNYNMIGYVVPHSLYKAGYHCDPKLPLPFMNIASQKNFVAVYHMGIYADADLLDWFTERYAEENIGKLDMGKSCIRFKKLDNIPFELIGELASKMTVKNWIDLYERNLKK
jgi:uncharacterized protein YdhG (YjbR/CyaY superfamily)